MTKSVRLNVLCPRGSGRKFKKCCQTDPDDSHLRYRGWRAIEDALTPQMLAYSWATQGAEGVGLAWSEFNLGVPREEYDPTSPVPINMLFLPWMIFNWLPDMELLDSGAFLRRTIADSFLLDVEVTAEEKNLSNAVFGGPIRFMK